MPQIRRFHLKILPEEIEPATGWIVLGLFMKLVLADNFAQALGTLSDLNKNALEVWFRTFALGFRIYFDFAGYSFIALGIGRLFGVRLTLNFLNPYLAVSPQDFWRRWHITLSTWIRDYLYFPLGGSRTRWWPAVLVLVFIISGAWHGAGWNFLLWGAIHGVGLVLWRLCGVCLGGSKIAGWLVTQLLVFIAWLPFFTTDISRCLDSLTLFVTPSAYRGITPDSTIRLFTSRGDFLVFAALMAMSFGVIACELWSFRKGTAEYGILRGRFAMLVMISAIILIGSTSEGDFVYFNF